MSVLRIVDWNTHFENSRSRGRANLHWVPIPNKHDGDGYTELIRHPNGAAHFGAWVLLVEVASKCQPRGVLLRDRNRPHDAESLSRVTNCAAAAFDEAIPRLLQIGWLESIEAKAPARLDGGDYVTPWRAAEEKDSTQKDSLERFWEKYPRKTGKEMACQYWLSHDLDAIADEVMAGLDRYLKSEEWRKEDGKYIPSAAKWLAEKRWQDDPKAAADDLPEYYRQL